MKWKQFYTTANELIAFFLPKENNRRRLQLESVLDDIDTTPAAVKAFDAYLKPFGAIDCEDVWQALSEAWEKVASAKIASGEKPSAIGKQQATLNLLSKTSILEPILIYADQNKRAPRNVTICTDGVDFRDAAISFAGA